MARHKIEPVVIATTPGTTSMEVDPAAKEIAKASPQIVIVGLAGTAAAFIKALRAAGGNSTIYGISISAGSIFGMGDQAHGVGFSIPVLSPFAARSELVRRYQADMLAAGHKTFSLSSMEGYVDACVLAEGMRRAGSSLNRASLIAGLERIEGWDAGGMRFNFSRGNHEGSTFVDVAIIGSGGRLLT